MGYVETKKEGDKVVSSIDLYTNLPVFSLYGVDRKPSKEMLVNVDVLVFDLQNIIHIYTMAYVMEACVEHDKHFVVLDRPNPISGNFIEGNFVEKDLRSFVGLYPIPNRHGMTIAELALFFNHGFDIKCEMTIVPMEGWERKMCFDDTTFYWVAPEGKVILQGEIGSKVVNPTKAPMEKDTVFDLASLTKVVATLPATLKLIDNGEIRLEDRVAFFLPEFDPQGKEEITLRHLLTHTSGLSAHRQFHMETYQVSKCLRGYIRENWHHRLGEKSFTVI